MIWHLSGNILVEILSGLDTSYVLVIIRFGIAVCILSVGCCIRLEAVETIRYDILKWYSSFDVFWCLLTSFDVFLCLLMPFDAFPCFSMPSDVLRCLPDVFHCDLMVFDDFWCLSMPFDAFQYLLIPFNVFHWDISFLICLQIQYCSLVMLCDAFHCLLWMFFDAFCCLPMKYFFRDVFRYLLMSSDIIPCLPMPSAEIHLSCHVSWCILMPLDAFECLTTSTVISVHIFSSYFT